MKRILVFLMVLALCLTGSRPSPPQYRRQRYQSLVDAKNGGDTVLEAVLNGEVEKE